MIPLPSLRRTLLLCAAASAFTLSVALIAQYGFGLAPCHLCILQRYPYAAVLALGVLGAWRLRAPKRQALALLLCGALFAIGGGIAVYHGGVERGWFPGPAGCTADIRPEATIEELRRQIMEAPLVTCDQAMAKFFGLSFAEWNALVYAFLTFTAFYVAWRHYRRSLS